MFVVCISDSVAYVCNGRQKTLICNIAILDKIHLNIEHYENIRFVFILFVTRIHKNRRVPIFI